MKYVCRYVAIFIIQSVSRLMFVFIPELQDNTGRTEAEDKAQTLITLICHGFVVQLVVQRPVQQIHNKTK